ncbi:MAG: methyl-accepting chemotaxis protein, partial [Planctomycetes bacterium]|nr:methyl-accepting chemotaxis protein [Planctomycetota bacterium]
MEASANVVRLIQEIATATNEQANGVDQVNTAVAQMDKVTQQNAATAEEAASAAEELTAQAGNLNTMVGDLIGLVEGKRRDGIQPSAPTPTPRRVMRVSSVSSPAPRQTIAPAAPQRQEDNVRLLPASEVIPLGEDDDF